MSEQKTKFETDDPRCEVCGESLDYCELEGVRCWWECGKCKHREGECEW